MKTIIIVGGSKGIGNATLKELVGENNIINISRSEPKMSHQNLTHYTCDVTLDELPEITNADCLIYSPGSINLKPFKRMSIEGFKSDFEINVISAIKCIQKYLPILKKSNSASILMFSTVASKLGMPFHTSVATSKSAVEGLVKSLGAELAPTIRVNAIAPTVTNTDLASKILRNENMIERVTERHPLKKILSPKEVSDMASFLISEKASSISGQIFQLDCGIVTFKM